LLRSASQQCLRRSVSRMLCPYTTLFRSCPRVLSVCTRILCDFCSSPNRETARNAIFLFFNSIIGKILNKLCSKAHSIHASAVLRDRKSTRLNSSHVKISYAVFCLKQQKQ